MIAEGVRSKKLGAVYKMTSAKGTSVYAFGKFWWLYLIKSSQSAANMLQEMLVNNVAMSVHQTVKLRNASISGLLSSSKGSLCVRRKG